MIAAFLRWSIHFSFAAMILALVLIIVKTDISSQNTSPLLAISTEYVNGSNLQSLRVRTGAYTYSDSTDSGKRLRTGKEYNSAAADWNRFPLGTVFRIEGDSTLYVVDDFASDLVGTNTIDIYRPTVADMNQWGVRNVEIEVLKIGDMELSRELFNSARSGRQRMAEHLDGNP